MAAVTPAPRAGAAVAALRSAVMMETMTRVVVPMPAHSVINASVCYGIRIGIAARNGTAGITLLFVGGLFASGRIWQRLHAEKPFESETEGTKAVLAFVPFPRNLIR